MGCSNINVKYKLWLMTNYLHVRQLSGTNHNRKIKIVLPRHCQLIYQDSLSGQISFDETTIE
jgi:hypothetical protein